MNNKRQNHWILACSAILIAGAHAKVSYGSVYPDTPDQLWPDGIVPYEYDPDVGDDQKCCLEAAMEIWEAEAGIVFVVRTDETDYVKVQRNTVGPNYPPPVGFRSGDGGHVLNLNTWCDGVPCGAESPQQKFGLVHEVGHVLGLSHTQQRTDWDQFIELNDCVIDPAFVGNFNPVTNSLAWPRTQMDVDSIMSYPVCVFSICRTNNCPSPPQDCPALCGTACSADFDMCATYSFKEPLASIWNPLRTCPGPQAEGDICVGQRNHISEWEKLVISWLYPPTTNWRFVEKGNPEETEDGTFYYPFELFEDGADDVPAGGTVWVQPGVYGSADGIYTKAMVVKGPLGGVVLN